MKLIICLLITFVLSSEIKFLRADNWNRADAQSRTQLKIDQKKISYQSEDETTKLGQVDDARVAEDHDGYSNLETDDLSNEQEINDVRSSFPPDSTKSVRLSMDNMVKEMRSKAVNKAYQNIDTQQPIEQSMDVRSLDHESDNIRVAVQSKRRYEFVPVHFDRDDMKQPRMIEIVSDTMPLRLHFKSQSAAIVVTQSHMSRKLNNFYNSFHSNFTHYYV